MVVTGSRGEYGYVRPILRLIEAREDLDYRLAITNMHLLPEFGADRASVIRSILAQGGQLAGAGIAIGLIASLFLTRTLANLLIGVGARDASVFGVKFKRANHVVHRRRDVYRTGQKRGLVFLGPFLFLAPRTVHQVLDLDDGQ